ncbi:MAG: fumarylacetoacetate hydrolase family protein [Pseudomonadota bacterium]|nr:fumarylacetoacetate hydrolase family protein [Pseudomonadota bacterium]
MKLANFFEGGSARLGLVEADEIVDIASAGAGLPTSVQELLGAGEGAMEAIGRAARVARRLPLSQVKLGPPITSPRKFLGLALSFRSHVEEMRAKGIVADRQMWFNKQVSCINGPYDDIHLPGVSRELDYEGELAFVIGRSARHVPRGQARSIIAGYFICNDVSVRDWQRRSPTGTLGKSFDTHGPIGPWLTTADEVPHPEDLNIRTWVDGELRQDGNTSELLYTFGEMIEELSTVFTLEPGDIITTGSPSGVGYSASPPRFLTAGQSVKVQIDGLGWIENRVVPEPGRASLAD